jgi:hypothetical protein
MDIENWVLTNPEANAYRGQDHGYAPSRIGKEQCIVVGRREQGILPV